MFCEVSPSARKVLHAHFPGVPVEHDIRALRKLPGADIVTAGFPCQDLSQAGLMSGIGGENSGLVNEVFRLIETAKKKPSWIVFENVPFMLALQKGQAMRHLIKSIESLGYKWAYRVVDARAFGVPQRRRRVILLASISDCPKNVLFSDDAGEPEHRPTWRTARGFYWTEGRTGLGWAVGAIPTLKGGSTIGIPSPPAIWFPGRRALEVPSIRDAERLQGFDPGWTEPAETSERTGRNARWKLVGNAVCVPMMEWLGHRLVRPKRYDANKDRFWSGVGTWPEAAWGDGGQIRVAEVSNWPKEGRMTTLNGFLRYKTKPLSARATNGFLERALASGLAFEEGFLEDVRHHLSIVSVA